MVVRSKGAKQLACQNSSPMLPREWDIHEQSGLAARHVDHATPFRNTFVSRRISLLEAGLRHFRMTAGPNCRPGKQTAVKR
jgi:hypothetical protein